METVFWIIVTLASLLLFTAIYSVNVRRNYVVGYFCVAVSMILINFGWVIVIAESYSK